jgi:YD repeat-containing protein
MSWRSVSSRYDCFGILVGISERLTDTSKYFDEHVSAPSNQAVTPYSDYRGQSACRLPQAEEDDRAFLHDEVVGATDDHPLEHVTSYYHDTLGRLISVMHPSGEIAEYSYDQHFNDTSHFTCTLLDRARRLKGRRLFAPRFTGSITLMLRQKLAPIRRSIRFVIRWIPLRKRRPQVFHSVVSSTWLVLTLFCHLRKMRDPANPDPSPLIAN